jgi:putative colanic acid biosysnthesis UDP-glucose lipid carrier transferase
MRDRSLLKDNAPLFEWIMRLVDPLIVIVAGTAVYRLYLGDWDLPERYWLAMLGMAALAVLLFPILRLYTPQRGVSLFDEMRRLVNAWLLMAAAWFAFLFMLKVGSDFSRVWSLYWLVAGLAASVATRGVIRLALRSLRRRGYNLRHIVVIGAGHLGQEIVARIHETPWSGFVVGGYYDDNTELHGRLMHGVPVLGAIDRAVRDLEHEDIDQVWIALPMRAERRIREVLSSLQQHSVQVCFVPDIFNFTLLHHSMTEIAGLPVINLTGSPLEGVNLLGKSIEDFVLSLAILVVTSPLLLLLAIGVKLSSPGPVFFRQERITWNGARFQMLKFRTMPTDAEGATGPVWATVGDRRSTPFGAFLRRWSLDELPQFINVLRGEMSIVGPRPERPEFVEHFRREIPGYMQKHLVKAGITGWAQVNDFRGNTSLTKRIQYDLYYIEHWSLWFDLRIIALTLVHVFTTRHAG